MRSASVIFFSAVMLTWGTACGGGASPVPIESGQPCTYCRMTIADVHLGAEVVAPGEEPRFYDDIGCLAHDLEKRAVPEGGRVFVADYQTGAMVPGETAVYSRVESIATPMMSHYVAHAGESARQSDARVRGGSIHTADELFGSGRLGDRHGR